MNKCINNIIRPNFNKSILNLSATLASFVGDKNDKPKLLQIEKRLENAPKNVVFIIFDGMGVYNINLLSKNSNFIQSNIKDILSSTMPATTTNATTTMMEAKYPDEHLWLSWSLWLKETRNVSEIYLSRDYYSHEQTKPYNEIAPVSSFLARAKTDRNIYAVAPSYAKFDGVVKKEANNIDELFEVLGQILSNKESNFIYCYCDEPDHTMHEFGITSDQTQNVFDSIQNNLQKFYKENEELLVIVTADHGHIDISNYYEIYKDTEILNMLERPISMEGRFANFKVKKGYKNKFKTIFNKKYGKDFELVESNVLLKKKIFGNGENVEEMKEFLGDFIAIGNDSYACFDLTGRGRLIGHHAGGSKAEMEVPLIILEKN